MTLVPLALLFTGSVAAGAINALAGGGSLVTLPILLAIGLPPTTAAATNAVAAWSGLIGGAVGSRRLLAAHRPMLVGMALLSGLGGVLGGAALLATPSRLLAGLLPWLVLFGTLCLVAAPLVDRRLGRVGAWDLSATGDLLGWRGVVLFAVAVLTGYFNPCGGIAMVAAFAFFGIDDIRLANALKILLGMVMTGASVVLFGAVGAVDWPVAALMVVGTVIGGWFGARLALGVDRRLLRGLIIGWGGMMSAVFLIPA